MKQLKRIENNTKIPITQQQKLNDLYSKLQLIQGTSFSLSPLLPLLTRQHDFLVRHRLSSSFIFLSSDLYTIWHTEEKLSTHIKYTQHIRIAQKEKYPRIFATRLVSDSWVRKNMFGIDNICQAVFLTMLKCMVGYT